MYRNCALICIAVLLAWSCKVTGQVVLNPRTANFPKQEEKAGNMPNKNRVWVFILAGQSNMAGRALVEPQDTLPSSRILTINQKNEFILAKNPIHFYESGMKGTGCGLAFGKELIKHIPKNVTILLLPTAVGGSSITQWINDSTFRGVQLLTNFREKVALGKKYGKIKAILWHQGETDATPEGIEHRRENLSQLFSEFRKSVDNPTLPILMGELGSYSKQPDLWSRMNEQIRAYSASDKYTSVISTADFKDKGDKIHFNSESQRKMGERFADEFMNKFNAK